MRPVTPALAASIIERAFPTLAPARVEPLGDGWDNVAVLVNDAWVFRFPRREIAVACLEAEIAVLPNLDGRLPLPVPNPRFVGRGDAEFPWPFAGYALLPGRIAPLTHDRRLAMAGPLGRFLRVLHDIGPAAVGASPDLIDRVNVERRTPRLLERLDRLADRVDVARLHAIVDGVTSRVVEPVLVHGDLHAAQILVDDDGAMTAVIDWGDVHAGDPATDLVVLYGLLPPAARDAFLHAYGPVDAATERLARWRAVDHALAILDNADHAGLHPEALTVLDNLVS